MKEMKKILVFFLCFVMVLGFVPASAFAAFAAETDVESTAVGDSALTAALANAKNYIDALTINASENDPAYVVSQWKKQFSWDNEDRESEGKGYLFEWSYYNGVVFEGLDYIYDVTGDTLYAEYVEEYLSSMITTSGGWATCSNDSTKQCAGYNAKHGADCYKTASLLMDYYKYTGEDRYRKVAEELYEDLTYDPDTRTDNQSNYISSAIGGNYKHTWSATSNLLWLDGLYMSQPFMAEYASYIGDTEELDLIADRFAWVSTNMYDEEYKLHYHAASGTKSNSGDKYWLRANGWYAAAMVDVMDYMTGKNLTDMQAQLKKLVDGIAQYQDSTGMWRNAILPNATNCDNRLETSGTALIAYAIMKAVNNGWLDSSYAEIARDAFVGICEQKLAKNNKGIVVLKDICWKGNPGGNNSTFYDNEGKGVGPFIMLYAEVKEYQNDQNTLTGITVTAPTKTAYEVGEDLDLTGMAVTAAYRSGKTETVTDYTVSGYDSAVVGEQTVTVTYKGMTATFTVTVSAKATEPSEPSTEPSTEPSQPGETVELTGIVVTTSAEVINFLVGRELSVAGVNVHAVYSDTTTMPLTWDQTGANGYTLSGYDMGVLGEQTVTVNYGGFTDSFKIKVWDDTFTESAVSVQVVDPGVSGITVENVTENETVAAAVEDVLTGFVAYDIDLAGYEDGNFVTVTLPIPEGVIDPAVYYVSDDGATVADMNAADNGNGTMSFVTNHFSIYVAGTRNDNASVDSGNSVTATGNLPGGQTVGNEVTSVTTGYYLLFNNRADKTLTGTQTTTQNKIHLQLNGAVNNNNTNLWYITHVSGNSYYVQYGGPNGKYLSIGDNTASLVDAPTQTTLNYVRNASFWELQQGNQYLNDYFGYHTTASGYWDGAAGDAGSRWRIYPVNIVNGDSVTFSASPATNVLTPGSVQDITYEIKLGNGTVNSADITWSSNNGNVASVANGRITAGNTEGVTTITARLNSVNGTALVTPITLTLNVEVRNRIITDISLSENEGYVPHDSAQSTVIEDKNGNPIIVTVSYDSGPDTTTYLTLEMLNETAAQLSKNDVYTGLTVSYMDMTEGNFTLNVVDNPGNNFPLYPNPGSVDVNKIIADSSQFQDVGVAEIQLSTSGVPLHTAVDAVLVLDLSNSMCWPVGENKYNANKTTKLDNVMAAVQTFAGILLEDNEDGSPTNNTISIVTFGGYDDQYSTESYIDVTRTLVSRTSDIEIINQIVRDTKFTAADTLQLAYYNGSRVATVVGSNRGDTNYDFAFAETSVVVDNIRAANGEDSNRDIHVLFMTDGAPTNFDGVYYRSSSATTMTYPATGANYTTYESWWRANKHTNPGFSDTSSNRNAATATNWLETIDTLQANGHDIATTLYDKVDGAYAIGFDMAHGSFSGIKDWDNVGSSTVVEAEFIDLVSKMVVDEAGNGIIPVTNATDTDTLNNFYTSLAHEIKEAATDAYFVDQLGNSFNIQMASSVTKFAGTDEEYDVVLNPAPHIQVSTYNVYKSSDVGREINGVNVTAAMIGERYGSPTVVETVTFNAAGTQAYSDKSYTAYVTNANGTSTATRLTAGSNILLGGVIYGQNFWYNTNSTAVMIDTDGDGTAETSLDKEAFYWNIGTIRDTEFVLSYYVYLEGSATGNAPAGSYKTNNYATLYYENYLDNDVSQDVESPVLAWKAAQVSYAFYLVNDNGEPLTQYVETATGSFYDAIKITSPVVFDSVYLNSQEVVVINPVAADILPDGYELYDTAARYTLTVDSSSGNQSATGWEIIKGNGLAASTYVTNYNGSYASNALEEDDPSYSYTNTIVWFAVKLNIGTVSDVVVIDYGLPVDISVLGNDMLGDNAALVGVARYDAEDPTVFTIGNVARGTYGAAIVNGNEVRYIPRGIVGEDNSITVAPGNLIMDSYDKFHYQASTIIDSNTLYYNGTVTVIPATTIYYEDNFVTYSFDEWSENKWVANTNANFAWTYVDNDNAAQDEDRPGEYSLPEIDADNLYGYDSAYKSMSMYSMNGYAMATVDYDHSAVAEFDFYGTGFDVVALSSSDTGTIIVKVYDSNNKVVKNFTVDTYYGYTAEMHDVKYIYTNGKWVRGEDLGKNETATAETKLPDNPIEGQEATVVEQVWVVNPSANNSLYQVPVMQIEGLTYDRYHAEIRVLYDPIFENVSGSTSYDFYLDAIRIYDPANDGQSDGSTDTTIEDAYQADHEGWPIYEELRNNVLAAGSFDKVANDELAADEKMTGLVFIDGDASVGNAQIEDYRNYGPNNELYLANGQDVAFILNLDDYCTFDENGEETGTIIASVQLGIKSANGDAVSYVISNINEAGQVYGATAYTVETSTDMYYNITAHRGDVIVISNTEAEGENGILSLTNIKVTFTEAPTVVEPLLYMTRNAAARTLRALNTVNSEETQPVEPEPTEPEPTEPKPTEPKPTEPKPTEPKPTEPKPTEPKPTEPKPTEPKPTEPKPTEPKPTEPKPTEPKPTEPKPTEPKPTEPKPEGSDVFEPGMLNVYLSAKSVKVGSSVIVTVTTSEDVQSLTVNGKAVPYYTYSSLTGTKTWVVTVKAEEQGVMDIDVVAYNTDGVACETVSNTVNVTKNANTIIDKLIDWLFG